MTVAQLLEILADPDLPPDTPIRVQLGPFLGTFDWDLNGAHATLAGHDRHLVLELRSAHLAETESQAGP